MHLGIDIGGTKTDAVLVSPDGVVLHRHVVPSGKGNGEVVTQAVLAAATVCDAAGISPGDAASVGVGIPGSVLDGVVSHAQNLGITRLDLASSLAEAWGVRPVVDNDVNAGAVGAWVAAGGEARSIAFLNLGTGLAAGLILDGKVWRGARGAAGEIGHISVDPHGPLGPDSLPGGLETYASGSGVALQSGGAPAVQVLAAADTDAGSARIREGLFFGVATAVRLLVLTLDVEEVLLGGGLTRMGEPLLDGTRRVIRGWERNSRFLASVDLTARMSVLDPETPVAAIGAAMRGAGRG
ncbi:ROK family protein [Demequina capsici]|uniref:ROK family protein n=1 Tax=Demequina capsici TaxID=3075620 RepID=A0AA96FBQ1_9MICO|nr:MULTISPECIES: ROK family protein [unclassified Demequina]WNM23955.1 ROK family protein [Demequina sp. OYTSA14]WNM26783.1 ROK family protein [Demequina sp. PMTSA13]